MGFVVFNIILVISGRYGHILANHLKSLSASSELQGFKEILQLDLLQKSPRCKNDVLSTGCTWPRLRYELSQ